jgi:hypothetical protein
MLTAIIRLLVGPAPSYPTGQERIVTLRDAILWRLGSVPGWDASVDETGRVQCFRVRQ